MNESTMAYGMMALDGYLDILKTLRELSKRNKNNTPDYDEVAGLVSERLEETKFAFSSRQFLRDCLDFEISDERIEEFEDFLGGRKGKILGLNEEITKGINILKKLDKIN
ncbi:MAG TPA: hypothetical protein VJ208_02615 [Candidatus Nanoarchaeia archaeon]|nr:hypothetical protein [Candidatus Nanoarchaeia archaeon]